MTNFPSFRVQLMYWIPVGLFVVLYTVILFDIQCGMQCVLILWTWDLSDRNIHPRQLPRCCAWGKARWALQRGWCHQGNRTNPWWCTNNTQDRGPIPLHYLRSRGSPQQVAWSFFKWLAHKSAQSGPSGKIQSTATFCVCIHQDKTHSTQCWD